MQTADELKSAIENIRYYAKELDNLVRKQYELDCQWGNEHGLSTDPAGLRFDCLGAISTAGRQIELYCDNIASNIKTAEKQDKEI